VLPLVVGRTPEVTRAVVRVISSETAQVDVSLDISENADAVDSGGRRNLTYDEFFQELEAAGTSPTGIEVARRLHDDFAADQRFVIDWKKASFVVKVRDPIERSRLFSVIGISKEGQASVWSLGGQLTRVGLPVELAYDYARKSGELLGISTAPGYSDCWARAASVDSLATRYEEFTAVMENLADEIYAQRSATES